MSSAVGPVVVPPAAHAVTEQVGVGPWGGGPESWPRTPDGHLDPRFDPELLAQGDRRNVVDQYRYWTVEAIVADLDRRRHPLQVAIENWEHDFNIGSVVRTANAFNAAGVHIVGSRRWNRRGAMVTDRYLHVHHHPDATALRDWAARHSLVLVGVDNVPGSIPVESYRFAPQSLLVFGQESSGLTAQVQAACRDVVHITQFGSTRSMNAGAAAAIAMFAWAQQHAGPPAPGTSGI